MVLNNTIYRIRTGHGISARTYQSDELRRILGVGQGSCAAPGIWMAVLDPILWSIANKFACFQMKSPSGKLITRIGDAYVDDAVFQATHNNPDCSHQELITSLPVLIEEILQDFRYLRVKKLREVVQQYKSAPGKFSRGSYNCISPRDTQSGQNPHLMDCLAISMALFSISC